MKKILKSMICVFLVGVLIFTFGKDSGIFHKMMSIDPGPANGILLSNRQISLENER